MPELPEVETIRQGLKKYLTNKAIVSVTTDTPKLFPNHPDLVQMHLIGSEIKDVKRRGKAMLIELASGYVLTVHLKMTGQMVYVDKEWQDKREEGKGRFTHIIFTLSDGSHLYYNDQRKFGWVKLLSAEEVAELKFLKEMGPEPFSKEFSADYFIKKLRRRPNTAIKTAILDQKVVAGVGNIYADESLFLSKIMPNRAVESLTDNEIKRLRQNIIKVLKYSIDLGGSSRKDYVNAVGQKGDYLDEAFVYNRTGQACRQCDSPIEKIKLVGRGTHFCRRCQK